MTLQQFEAVTATMRLGYRAAYVARRVLVDGLTKAKAARESGISPQAARESVQRVEAALRKTIGAPDGWVCVTVCLPPNSDAVKTVTAIEKTELRKAGLLV